jgi:hypothetical protein
LRHSSRRPALNSRSARSGSGPAPSALRVKTPLSTRRLTVELGLSRPALSFSLGQKLSPLILIAIE